MRQFWWMMAALLAASPAWSQQVRPGDNLVLGNIPEIPAGLAAQFERYGNIRTARFLSWLPGDVGMLIATRFAQIDQIHLVRTAEGRREQLTFGDDRVAWARHSPAKASSVLVFGRDTGGNESYQIYRLDRATGQASLLTDGHSRNLPAVWSPAGDRIAWSSTQRNGRDFDLYTMDPAAPAGKRLLVQTEGLHLPLEFSPDGQQLLVQHYVSINESHLYLVDTADGARSDLTPADEKEVAYPAAHFSADGKRIYLTTDRGWEVVRLAFLELKDPARRLQWVTEKPDWDVEDFALSPDGKLVAWITNAGGFSKLHLADTRRNRPAPAPDLPAGVVRGLEFSPSGQRLALGLQNNQLPSDVFAIELKRKRLERWTISETGGLDTTAFSEPRLIHYPTFDQDIEGPRKIPALLHLPDAQRFPGPHPVLISIHGGPEGQARPTFLGAHNFRINELGIALIQPNVRGSAGYGKNYLLLDNGKLRENSVKDIGALLDWIAEQPELDASRVCVSGGSYGGYMSLASLTYFSDRLRCGIDYVGISSFVTFLENTKEYRRDLRRAEYGDERKQGMRIFLDMISPLNNADKIKAPLLVLHGANDPRVPASEAEQIAQRVQSSGGTVWTLLAKDEGHGFVKKANIDFANLVTILFLQTHLLPAR
jgi:dipeptidyl aminopeptidase/acylaminoacyl peptidase